MPDSMPPVPDKSKSRRPAMPDLHVWAEFLAANSGDARRLVKTFLAGGDRTQYKAFKAVRDAAKAALVGHSRLDHAGRERVQEFLTAYPESPRKRTEEPRDERIHTTLTETEKARLDRQLAAQRTSQAAFVRAAVMDRVGQGERKKAR